MAKVGVTKQVLAYAIKDLMSRQPLAKITVGDICQACGMNRKSFYYHFQDKYDLVAWIFRGELAAEIEDNATLPGMMGALCRTMEKNVAFYRAALREQGQNSLQEYITAELLPVIKRALAPHTASIPYADHLSGLYAETCCTCLVRWVQEGCLIPSAQFLRLLTDAAMTAGKLVGATA